MRQKWTPARSPCTLLPQWGRVALREEATPESEEASVDEHVIPLCPACGPERAQEGTAPLANNDAPATPAPVAALDPTLTAIESPAGPAPAAEPAFAPQPDAAGVNNWVFRAFRYAAEEIAAARR